MLELDVLLKLAYQMHLLQHAMHYQHPLDYQHVISVQYRLILHFSILTMFFLPVATVMHQHLLILVSFHVPNLIVLVDLSFCQHLVDQLILLDQLVVVVYLPYHLIQIQYQYHYHFHFLFLLVQVTDLHLPNPIIYVILMEHYQLDHQV